MVQARGMEADGCSRDGSCVTKPSTEWAGLGPLLSKSTLSP